MVYPPLAGRLDFSGDVATPPATSLKRFDYIVVGDARLPEGIVAPYDEENTASICKIEHVNETDILSFWRGNANTDMFSPLDVQRQVFADRA